MMKKIGIVLSVLAFVVLVVSCGMKKQKSYFFNASQIVDHPDTTQVKKMMGVQPDSSYYRLYFGKLRFIQQYFAQDSLEFRFKDDKLIEVIVNKPSMDYQPKSITKFGLPFKEPSSEDSLAYYIWKNEYKGFDVVNFYRVGDILKNGKPRYKVYFKLHNGAQESAQK